MLIFLNPGRAGTALPVTVTGIGIFMMAGQVYYGEKLTRMHCKE